MLLVDTVKGVFCRLSAFKVFSNQISFEMMIINIKERRLAIVDYL
jgi:hypothetical protein